MTTDQLRITPLTIKQFAIKHNLEEDGKGFIIAEYINYLEYNLDNHHYGYYHTKTAWTAEAIDEFIYS